MIVKSCKGSEVKVKVGVGRGKLKFEKKTVFARRAAHMIYIQLPCRACRRASCPGGVSCKVKLHLRDLTSQLTRIYHTNAQG